MSLAEVFRDCALIAAAKDLYERWIKGFAVVGHRTRSMSSGSQGSREPALGGKGKGSKGISSSGSDHEKGKGDKPGKGKHSYGSSSLWVALE